MASPMPTILNRPFMREPFLPDHAVRTNAAAGRLRWLGALQGPQPLFAFRCRHRRRGRYRGGRVGRPTGTGRGTKVTGPPARSAWAVRPPCASAREGLVDPAWDAPPPRAGPARVPPRRQPGAARPLIRRQPPARFVAAIDARSATKARSLKDSPS